MKKGRGFIWEFLRRKMVRRQGKVVGADGEMEKKRE